MLDAFGHSATNARLFSEFGFEAIFFARLDDKDRAERLKSEALTFIWRTSPDHFGKERQILALTTPHNYSPMPQFKSEDIWNMKEADNPIQDDPTLNNYNAENKTIHLINHVTYLSKT